MFKYGQSSHDYIVNIFELQDTFTKYVFRIFDPFRLFGFEVYKNAEFHANLNLMKKCRKNIKKSFRRTGEKVEKVQISVTFWFNNFFCCIFSNFFNDLKSARNSEFFKTFFYIFFKNNYFRSY